MGWRRREEEGRGRGGEEGEIYEGKREHRGGERRRGEEERKMIDKEDHDEEEQICAGVCNGEKPYLVQDKRYHRTTRFIVGAVAPAGANKYCARPTSRPPFTELLHFTQTQRNRQEAKS